MTEKDIEKAKSLFNKNLCRLEYLKDNDEWNKLNVPNELIILWVKETIDEYLSVVDNNIDNDWGKNDSVENILDPFKSALYRISEYNLFEYLDRIINIFDKLFYDGNMIISEIYPYYDRIPNLMKLLLYDTKLIFDQTEEKMFDTGERYYGLLPLLYKSCEYKYFNKLYSNICDFIEYVGFCNNYTMSIVKYAYEYIDYINNTELKEKIKESILCAKKHYNILNPRWNINHIEELRLDEDIDVIRNNYYSCLLGMSLINKYANSDQFRHISMPYCDELKRIYKQIEYYGLDRSILNEWNTKMHDRVVEMLHNIDNYINIDLSFIDNSNHSRHFKDILKREISYDLQGSIYCALRYYMYYDSMMYSNVDLITEALKKVVNKFDSSVLLTYIFDDIVSKDGKKGWLVTFYNRGNTELYQMFRKDIIKRLKVEKYYIDMANNTLLFANYINDYELANECKCCIDRYNESIREFNKKCH